MDEEEFLIWQSTESIRIYGLSNMELLDETLSEMASVDYSTGIKEIWTSNRLVSELNDRLSNWLTED